ncbi:MAG: transposase [Phycisphaerales bacterium]|nr:transposase [Phycisphaerales bacterium]MBK9120911.1 transposase [Phycisphaerales bacterium]
MLTLTNEQLDWLADRIPDRPKSPKGGRPVADKRRTLRGIFWMLDNGAKWKDLPREFGAGHGAPLVPALDARRAL